MTDKNFGFGTQIRKSPYFNATVRYGAKGFSVYNHMYIPRDFGSPEQNFWNLIENAILCDVAVERQVEITGPDAFKFIQLLTPRDLSKLAVGQCKYVLIVNNDGGILNDPVLLRLDTNHFWLSLADSDVLFWAQGVAINSGLNVKITEPDVSPLQLQGPKSGDIMVSLFGESIKDLKYYWLKEYELDGIPLIISRTGWSSELGYEIYLRDGSKGDDLYEKIMTESDINFIGKDALKKIRNDGIKRKQVGIELDCEPLLGPNTTFWTIMNKSEKVGKVTSAVYSPRLKKNIALAMVDIKYTDLGTKLQTKIDDKIVNCTIVEKPFFDPKKKIASS